MADITYYGGQAVIEGVMMRGKKNMVTAVRRPGGGLAIDVRQLHKIYTGKMRKTPFIRGIIVLIEALVLGIQMLMFSANVSMEEEDVKISGPSIWIVLIVGLAFGVAIFFMAPLFITRLLDPFIESSLVFHLVEGLVRLVIFIAYLKIISLMPDIRRVFSYHGAEHMAVNAYESGVPLDLESVKQFSKAHVRCGTSFLFAVLVIAIIVFALIGKQALYLMVVWRILLIPVIAGLGYEVTYFSGRHVQNVFVRTILAPGLWLQGLTTRKPDESQLEVAVTALNKVIELDNLEETTPSSQPQAETSSPVSS
ncbi:DUF1385 domain-containing protein [Chloroflexota bacterium]